MIVALAWSIAAVLAIVVLGFCAYEVRWKLNRLSSDIARLRSVADRLAELQSELTAAAAALPTRGPGH